MVDGVAVCACVCWLQVYQTNFSVRVTLPAGLSSPNAILQLKYVSNNPDEIDPPSNTDAIFYNCVDLYVATAPNAKAAAPAKPSQQQKVCPACPSDVACPTRW